MGENNCHFCNEWRWIEFLVQWFFNFEQKFKTYPTRHLEVCIGLDGKLFSYETYVPHIIYNLYTLRASISSESTKIRIIYTYRKLIPPKIGVLLWGNFFQKYIFFFTEISANSYVWYIFWVLIISKLRWSASTDSILILTLIL